MPQPVFSVCLLLLILVATGTAQAQSPRVSHPEWIVMGIGAAMTERPPDVVNSTSINLHISYNFERRRTSYQAAFDYISQFMLGGRPQYHTAALNAGIGRRAAGTYFLMV